MTSSAPPLSFWDGVRATRSESVGRTTLLTIALGICRLHEGGRAVVD